MSRKIIKMPQNSFTMYIDPGHAWVKVPLTLLTELHITNDISRYSYQRDSYVYLEEDLDLAVFWKAYLEKYGADPTFTEKNSDRYSRIRSYAAYSVP
jgi:hypothetical protein